MEYRNRIGKKRKKAEKNDRAMIIQISEKNATALAPAVEFINGHTHEERLAKMEIERTVSNSEAVYKNIVQALCDPALTSEHRLRLVHVVSEIENKQNEFVKNQFTRMKTERDTMIRCCRHMTDELRNMRCEDKELNAQMERAKKEAAEGHKQLMAEVHYFAHAAKNLTAEIDYLCDKRDELEAEAEPLRTRVASLQKAADTMRQQCARQQKVTDDAQRNLTHERKKEGAAMDKLADSIRRLEDATLSEKHVLASVASCEAREKALRDACDQLRDKRCVLNTRLLDAIEDLRAHEKAVKNFESRCASHLVLNT